MSGELLKKKGKKEKQKMSEQKTKSNAPWILGLVGFALSIPQVICSILCAGAAAGVAGASAEVAGADSAEQVATAASAGIIFMLPVICTFSCFILSFFGKSKISTATGVLLILLGLLDVYACVVNLSTLGIAAAICFACAGISSICNTKKIKA